MEAHHTRLSHDHGGVERTMNRPLSGIENVPTCRFGERAFAAISLKRKPVGMAPWLLCALLLSPYGGTAYAQELIATRHALPRIEAGTLVSTGTDAGESSGRWNRVVLLARPRIASGDVESLSTAIRDSVSDFVLTILASVEEFHDPTVGQSRFRLVDVGVGYSTQVNGEMRTVTVADAAKVGVKLGIFPRMLLAENEKKLATATITARTSTLMIIDTPAVVLRDKEHHEFIMRHFIWVEPTTGRNAALVWLIDHDKAGHPVVDANEPPRWAPAGLREDRAIHVDGKEFNFIGIPNDRAFAIEDLPPGRPIPWTAEARALAAKPSYQVEELRSLSLALNAMLQATRATPPRD